MTVAPYSRMYEVGFAPFKQPGGFPTPIICAGAVEAGAGGASDDGPAGTGVGVAGRG